VKTMITIKATIHGAVQGVFFRQSTFELATELTLTGWVKNTTDKTVQLIATGIPENIASLIEWLNQGGPDAATITTIDWREIPLEAFDHFEILD
jgi:acylphosphatase